MLSAVLCNNQWQDECWWWNGKDVEMTIAYSVALL
jgi:hypothetical protein